MLHKEHCLNWAVRKGQTASGRYLQESGSRLLDPLEVDLRGQ